MDNTLSFAHDRVVAAVLGHVGSTSLVTFLCVALHAITTSTGNRAAGATAVVGARKAAAERRFGDLTRMAIGTRHDLETSEALREDGIEASFDELQS